MLVLACAEIYLIDIDVLIIPIKVWLTGYYSVSHHRGEASGFSLLKMHIFSNG